MRNSKRTLNELASLAEEIFDRKIRPLLQPEDHGKFVAINLETGEFEMDPDDYTAAMGLRHRAPTADIWLIRAGYPTTYEMR